MELPDAPRDEVRAALRYIHFTNRLLGGYRLLRDGLQRLISAQPEKRHWRILDLGCGDGQVLQVMARWAERKGYTVEWTGLDIDKTAIAAARQEPELAFARFVDADAADPGLDYSQYDIVTGTLFLHHLTSDEIKVLFERWKSAGTQVLINDLQRSRWAWWLFRIFATITAAPRMARHDGALSVRRAFRRAELESLAGEAGFSKFSLEWKWAFRYQLILRHDARTH